MLKKYGGLGVTVSDEEILDAQKRLSASTGLFAEPSSASVLAGLIKKRSVITDGETVVLLVTGSGLKDIDGAMKALDQKGE
jgi:threonine synthase